MLQVVVQGHQTGKLAEDLAQGHFRHIPNCRLLVGFGFMAMDETHKDGFLTCAANSICAIGLAIIHKEDYPAEELAGFNK